MIWIIVVYLTGYAVEFVICRIFVPLLEDSEWDRGMLRMSLIFCITSWLGIIAFLLFMLISDKFFD